jgi:Na+-driven multidrug efflux pump
VNASAVIVGKKIGEGDHAGAARAARFYSALAPLFGLVIGLSLAGASLVMPGFYNVSRAVQADAAAAMIIYGCFLPLRLFNWQIIVGVLRAGGDTLFSLAMDLGGTWLVGLPLSAVAGLALGAPFWLVYLLTLTEDVPKVVLGMRRLRSGRWLNDLTARTRGATGAH